MRLIRKLFLLGLSAGLIYLLLWSGLGAALFRWGSSPVIWLTEKVSLRHWKQAFTSKELLIKENNQLQAETDRLKKEIVELEEIRRENQRYKELLKFQSETQIPSVAARVIGRDPTRWFKGILINKGSRDGLKKHLPVVSPQGLVGALEEVSPEQSKVRLIVDLSSRVGALLQENRELGILRGMQREGCRLDYISRNASLREGERILTSGMGSLYPKGILIGTSFRIKKQKGGLYQSTRVMPAVDFNKLEEVSVLLYSAHKEGEEP